RASGAAASPRCRRGPPPIARARPPLPSPLPREIVHERLDAQRNADEPEIVGGEEQLPQEGAAQAFPRDRPPPLRGEERVLPPGDLLEERGEAVDGRTEVVVDADVLAGEAPDRLPQRAVLEQAAEEGQQLLALRGPGIDGDHDTLGELLGRGGAPGHEHGAPHAQRAHERARDLAVGREAQREHDVGGDEMADERREVERARDEEPVPETRGPRPLQERQGPGRPPRPPPRPPRRPPPRAPGGRGPPATAASSPFAAVARPGAVTRSASSGSPSARRAAARSGRGSNGKATWCGRWSTGRPGRRSRAREATCAVSPTTAMAHSSARSLSA